MKASDQRVLLSRLSLLLRNAVALLESDWGRRPDPPPLPQEQRSFGYAPYSGQESDISPTGEALFSAKPETLEKLSDILRKCIGLCRGAKLDDLGDSKRDPSEAPLPEDRPLPEDSPAETRKKFNALLAELPPSMAHEVQRLRDRYSGRRS